MRATKATSSPLRTDAELCTALWARLGQRIQLSLGPIEDALSQLSATERQAVQRAIPARQREFATGRVQARRLLQGLGVAPAALLPGPDRDPLWPEGVAGSISHNRECCAVAVCPVSHSRSLGIDVEFTTPLEPELWERILTPRELSRLAQAPASERGSIAKLIFSAKESLYKYQYPLTRERLEFHEVEIELDRARRSFEVLMPARCSLPASQLEGLYECGRRWVFTSVVDSGCLLRA